MSDDTEQGLWARTAPPAPRAHPQRGADIADVVVIGAGYTGLSAALHLAQGGAQVMVLEAHLPGHGGSGRNVGLVNAGLWVMPRVLRARLGEDRGARLLACLARAPAEVWEVIERHSIACEADRSGTLHCAADAAGARALAARAAQWQALGAPVTLLEGADAQARTGSPAFRAALHDARAGTVQPLAYARGLARAAVAAGARLHSDSPVRAITRDGGGWRLDTPGGQVRAGRVIVATNAWSGPLWPALRDEIAHLPYFNLATPPLPAPLRATVLPGGAGLWDTRRVLTSLRMDRAGRLVIGSVGALAPGARAIHHAWAARRLRHIFPQLPPMPFVSGWWGQIGITADALPRLHRLAPGVLSVGGYNGRGIAPGTVFGRMLAEYLLAGETAAAADALPLPFTAPKPMALRGLRSAVYRHGAAAWHLIDARAP